MYLECHEEEFIVSGKEANAIRIILDSMTLPTFDEKQKKLEP
jgi:hypothetical protein